jgi:hypothetical protein
MLAARTAPHLCGDELEFQFGVGLVLVIADKRPAEL